MTAPAGDKPYKKYRASRIRKPYGGGLALGSETAEPARSTRHGNGNGDPARIEELADTGAPRRRRRLLTRWYVFVPLLLILASLVAATVWAYTGYSTFDKAVHRANRRISRDTRHALTPDAGSILRHPTTILVLGSDARTPSEPARSDSIMLMRVDPRKKTITQLSIPRDTLVAIPDHGETKINEAFFYGNAKLAIRTVRGYMGVPINHVVVIRFRGFPRLINSIGGVTIDVPNDISSWYSGGKTVTFKKGRHTLNGEDALIYSRIRYADDDFHRMARQQQVVQALKKKIAEPRNLVRLPTIGSDFMSGVSTDLTTNELLELAYLQWRTKPSHQRKLLLTGVPTMVGGGSYVIVDPAVKQRTVQKFLGR